MSRSRPALLAARLLRAGRSDRGGGVALLVGTLVALAWSNWPHSSSYPTVWQSHGPGAALGLHLTLRDWVNEGLMVGFFGLVGFEIRREVVAGELRRWQRALSPTVAALAGMVVPAAIYALLMVGSTGSHGWGIPMATDVAFAVGTLALLGGHRFPRLRPYLMTLAVADDIASIAVLVIFYSHGVSVLHLLAAVCLLALMAAMAAAGIAGWPHLVLGAAAWWALLHAGVEPAVVGLAVGLLFPGRSHRFSLRRGRGQRGPRFWEEQLEPWVNFIVLPVFALANTGVRFVGSGISTGPALRILLAVAVARVVGKPIGIFVATRMVQRAGREPEARRLPSRPLLAMGSVASVGFTVPLLIIATALASPRLAAGATTGLLVGSLLGAVLAWLVMPARRPAPRVVTRATGALSSRQGEGTPDPTWPDG